VGEYDKVLVVPIMFLDMWDSKMWVDKVRLVYQMILSQDQLPYSKGQNVAADVKAVVY
jgi:hypothetical protein